MKYNKFPKLNWEGTQCLENVEGERKQYLNMKVYIHYRKL